MAYLHIPDIYRFCISHQLEKKGTLHHLSSLIHQPVNIVALGVLVISII